MDSMTRLCGYFVYWWDGEYEGNCVRDFEHDGPHYDWISWYNDFNEEVEEPEEEIWESY